MAACHFFRPQMRRQKLSWLPPYDSNVPSSVNSGAPSPRWLDGNEWWRNRELNPAGRSCKDQLQPAAFPEMVPRVGFEPTSSVLQTDAFTRLASWACGADQRNRTAIIARAAQGTPNIPGP